MELSRYMAIKYYRKLLSTQTLYFPRYDKLGDKLEGSMLNYVNPAELVNQILAGMLRIVGTTQDAEEIVRTVLRDIDLVLYEKFLQNFTFVSCWRQGVEESSLMWRVYDGKDEHGTIKHGGVMIKSDLSSLTNSLTLERNSPRSVDTIFQTLADLSDKYSISIENFRKVNYLPLEEQLGFLGLDRYFSKQEPYADEKEFRVVAQVGLTPPQRPNISLLVREANVTGWDEKKMSDLIIEIRDKMIQSYNTQRSALETLLPNCQSKPHVKLAVDITSLIKEVVISPYGDVESDMREIEKINCEFGLSVPVKRSKIETVPPEPPPISVRLPDKRDIEIDY